MRDEIAAMDEGFGVTVNHFSVLDDCSKEKAYDLGSYIVNRHGSRAARSKRRKKSIGLRPGRHAHLAKSLPLRDELERL